MVSSVMVEMSPKSFSPRAIFANTRRIIFPERVFGRPRTFNMRSGVATGPIDFRTTQQQQQQNEMNKVRLGRRT